MPDASNLFCANSLDVRNQRRSFSRNNVEKLLMFGSVLAPADWIGVSTSSTLRSAKNFRINEYKSARRRNASRKRSSVFTQKFRQFLFVPDVDAQFLRLVEFRTGFRAGDDAA